MKIFVTELPPPFAESISGNKIGWEVDETTDWWNDINLYRADYDWLHVESVAPTPLYRFRPIYSKGGKRWTGSWVEVFEGVFAVASG